MTTWTCALPRASDPQAKVRWAKAISSLQRLNSTGQSCATCSPWVIELVATKADAGLAGLHVLARRDEPRGHVVERAAGLAERGDPAHLRTLFGVCHFAPTKGGLPNTKEHSPAQEGPPSLSPAHRRGRCEATFAAGCARRPGRMRGSAVVHDVIHHPQRGLRDAGRELADLNAVELVHINPRNIRHPSVPKLVRPAELRFRVKLLEPSISRMRSSR